MSFAGSSSHASSVSTKVRTNQKKHDEKYEALKEFQDDHHDASPTSNWNLFLDQYTLRRLTPESHHDGLLHDVDEQREEFDETCDRNDDVRDGSDDILESQGPEDDFRLDSQGKIINEDVNGMDDLFDYFPRWKAKEESAVDFHPLTYLQRLSGSNGTSESQSASYSLSDDDSVDTDSIRKSVTSETATDDSNFLSSDIPSSFSFNSALLPRCTSRDSEEDDPHHEKKENNAKGIDIVFDGSNTTDSDSIEDRQSNEEILEENEDPSIYVIRSDGTDGFEDGNSCGEVPPPFDGETRDSLKDLENGTAIISFTPAQESALISAMVPSEMSISLCDELLPSSHFPILEKIPRHSPPVQTYESVVETLDESDTDVLVENEKIAPNELVSKPSKKIGSSIQNQNKTTQKCEETSEQERIEGNPESTSCTTFAEIDDIKDPNRDSLMSSLYDKSISASFTKIACIPFAKGSYSPCVPLMLTEPKWMQILLDLMPQSHADVVLGLYEEQKHGMALSVTNIMKWAKNNPVVAAYGVLNSPTGAKTMNRLAILAKSLDDCGKSRFTSLRRARRECTRANITTKGSPEAAPNTSGRSKPVLEWEVYLDQTKALEVDIALMKADQAKPNRAKQQDSTPAYNQEHLNDQIEKLISSMTLGGTSSSLSVNPASSSSHSSQNKGGSTTKEESKGVLVKEWLSIFSRALQLSNDNVSSKNEIQKETEVEKGKESTLSELYTYFGINLLFGNESTAQQSPRRERSFPPIEVSSHEITKNLKEPLHVILKLMSDGIPPKIWACLVDHLRSQGIHVDGISSFDISLLRSVGPYCSSAVTEILFFHSAGDLQSACHEGKIKSGDTVYFNAVSLLMPRERGAAARRVKNIQKQVIFQPYAYPHNTNEGKLSKNKEVSFCKSTLKDYKLKLNLQIGCYINEQAASEKTVDAIARFINCNKSIYNLGFAWGGLNGKHIQGINDGYWKKGQDWNYDIALTSLE